MSDFPVPDHQLAEWLQREQQPLIDREAARYADDWWIAAVVRTVAAGLALGLAWGAIAWLA